MRKYNIFCNENLNPVKPYLLFILSFFYCSSFNTANAQISIEWQKAYGGTNEDGAEPITGCNNAIIRQTKDGGYIFASATVSNDGDVNGHNGGYTDAWIVKLNQFGVIQWKKCFGTDAEDVPLSIEQTADEGFIFCGYKKVSISDVKTWIVKLDRTGNKSWELYPGAGHARLVKQLPNSYFIVQASDSNYKIEPSGTIIRRYANNFGNIGMYGTPISGDNYVSGWYGDGGKGDHDACIIKSDSGAKKIWQVYVGGSKVDQFFNAIELSDKSIVAAGHTYSVDKDITTNHDTSGLTSDILVTKVDKNGTIIWTKTFGGGKIDAGYSIIEGHDKNIIVTGVTWSNDGDINGKLHGTSPDVWVICLDKDGKLLWHKVIGGNNSDKAYSIVPTTNYGYMVAGMTNSSDHDATGNGYHSDIWERHDIWAIRLITPQSTSVPETSNNTLQNVTVYPTLTNGTIQVTLPQEHTQATMQMFNTMGQLIPVNIEGKAQHKTLTITNVSAGMYLLHISSGNDKSIHKIIYRP